jgi:hypothetical protein
MDLALAQLKIDMVVGQNAWEAFDNLAHLHHKRGVLQMWG